MKNEGLVRELKLLKADILSMYAKYGICTNGKFGKVVCNDCPLYYGDKVDCYQAECVWGLANLVNILIDKHKGGEVYGEK